MQNKLLVVATLLFVVVAFFVASIYVSNSSKENLSKIDNIDNILLRDYSIKYGENSRNISVVEFIDPECESCAIFHNIMKKLYKDYYKDIQIVTKYIPNHKNSIFAIKILEASRQQGLYNEVLDLVFSTQHIWSKHNAEKPELLWDFVGNIPNIDIQKLRQDTQNPKLDEIIKQDKEDSLKLNVNGTPTIFVNSVELKTLSQKALFDLVEENLLK